MFLHTAIFGLIIFVPGMLFAVEYKKVRLFGETDAETYRRKSTIPGMILVIGIPFLGIIYCAWVLIFMKDRFLRARGVT